MKSAMGRLKAVCWDFDGVIADTENAHVAAWERTFAEMGIDVAAEVCARAAEEDDRAFLAEVFAKSNVPNGDVEGWTRRKQSLTESILRDSPRIYPGVIETIDRLASGGIRSAIVTTTWRANVSIVLDAAGLADRFELIVAKEDVRLVKPDPEAYALALKRLKVPAAAAIALEDSPTGIASARAAGLRAIAIGHRRPEGEWSNQAISYVKNFFEADVEAIFKQ